MPKSDLKSARIVVPALTAALVLMAPVIMSTGAYAIEPTRTTKDRGLQFTDVSLTVNKQTNDQGFVTSASLSSTFEVTGAGTGGKATLTSTALVTQGCINKGGNDPEGLKRTRETTTGSITFEAHQGRGGGTVTTNAITSPSAGFTCPSEKNMTPVLVGVEFTNIKLTVTTDEGKSITATFANQDP
jgi:hypothetical protein